MRLPITILMPPCACAPAAQELPKTPAPAVPPPGIRAGAQHALLDVVMRDRTGKPVRNLQSRNAKILDEGGQAGPTHDDSLQASAAGDLSYYFVVYPQGSGADRPQLTMEFLKDGVLLSKASPELLAAGTDGRIPYIAGLPIADFSAGQYQWRTTVKRGASIAEEFTAFLLHS